jgi:hypothetical protein
MRVGDFSIAVTLGPSFEQGADYPGLVFSNIGLFYWEELYKSWDFVTEKVSSYVGYMIGTAE